MNWLSNNTMDNVKRIVRLVGQVIVDFIFISIIIWLIHLLVSWPWILIGVITAVMVLQRAKSFDEPLN